MRSLEDDEFFVNELKGDDARGDDAGGDDARGDDARGVDAGGVDAGGDGARSDGARSDDEFGLFDNNPLRHDNLWETQSSGRSSPCVQIDSRFPSCPSVAYAKEFPPVDHKHLIESYIKEIGKRESTYTAQAKKTRHGSDVHKGHRYTLDIRKTKTMLENAFLKGDIDLLRREILKNRACYRDSRCKCIVYCSCDEQLYRHRAGSGRCEPPVPLRSGIAKEKKPVGA